MRTISWVRAAVSALLLVSVPPAFAESPWRLRVAAASLTPDGESEIRRPNGKIVTTEVDSGAGARISLEYRFRPRLGLSVGYLRSSGLEAELRQDFPDGTDFADSDPVRFDALTAGITWQITPARSFDLYFEPFLLYAVFDDARFESAGPPFDRVGSLAFSVDDQVGLGALLGLDVPLGRTRWSAHASAGFLALGFEGTAPGDAANQESSSSIDLDLNPLVLTVGVGWRF